MPKNLQLLSNYDMMDENLVYIPKLPLLLSKHVGGKVWVLWFIQPNQAF